MVQIIHYELKHDRYIVFRFLRTSELRKRRLEFWILSLMFKIATFLSKSDKLKQWLRTLRYCTRGDRFDISLTDSITRSALNSRTCLCICICRLYYSESTISKWTESYITLRRVISITRYLCRIAQVIKLYKEECREV